jgi:rubrerythrin
MISNQTEEIDMADIGNAQGVIGFDRKLTSKELARALRLSIADEYEAIQVYSQIAEATEDEGVRAVIMDIVGEEQRHASQFWELLAEVDPSEHVAWEKAVKENKALMEEARSKNLKGRSRKK